jgi:predicted DNA-binding transcriptional regulator AlpA
MTDARFIHLRELLAELKRKRASIYDSYDEHNWPGAVPPKELAEWRELSKQIASLQARLDAEALKESL